MVSCRLPPAIAGPEPGIDGLAAGVGRQYRRRLDDLGFSPDVQQLAGTTPDCRAVPQPAKPGAGRTVAHLAGAATAGTDGTAYLAGRGAVARLASGPVRRGRRPHLSPALAVVGGGG